MVPVDIVQVKTHCIYIYSMHILYIMELGRPNSVGHEATRSDGRLANPHAADHLRCTFALVFLLLASTRACRPVFLRCGQSECSIVIMCIVLLLVYLLRPRESRARHRPARANPFPARTLRFSSTAALPLLPPSASLYSATALAAVTYPSRRDAAGGGICPLPPPPPPPLPHRRLRSRVTERAGSRGQMGTHARAMPLRAIRCTVLTAHFLSS